MSLGGFQVIEDEYWSIIGNQKNDFNYIVFKKMLRKYEIGHAFLANPKRFPAGKHDLSGGQNSRFFRCQNSFARCGTISLISMKEVFRQMS